MRTSLLFSFGFTGLSVLGLALASGCGGNGTGGSGGAGGAGSTSASSSSASSSSVSSSSVSSSSSSSGGTGASDITGTSKSDWISEAGEQKGIPDAGVVVAAVFQKPDKTWGEIAGTDDPATGNFVIKAVPDGPYYLKVGTNVFYALTARSGIDLGYVAGGRPDAKKIATSPTNLALNLTGLTAWQDTDDIELFSLGANAWGSLPALAPTPPMAGDTMLTGFTPDLSQLPLPGLIDGSKGDKVTLTHIIGRTAGNLPYQSLGQTASLPSLTLKDGQPSLSSGAFQDVPQTKVTVAFQRSAFAALLASAGPGATAVSYDLSAFTEPGGVNRASTAAPPTLIYLSDAAATDVTLDLSYGNPFPATWGTIASATLNYRIVENVPMGLKNLNGTISVSGPIDMVWKGAVVPQISPPTGVTIDGKAATTDLTGVSDAPVIAWKAPAMGTPTAYRVRIYSYGMAGRKVVGNFYTTDTSVAVPSGLLQKATSYAVAIYATTGISDLKAPHRNASMGADAAALTPLFTP